MGEDRTHVPGHLTDAPRATAKHLHTDSATQHAPKHLLQQLRLAGIYDFDVEEKLAELDEIAKQLRERRDERADARAGPFSSCTSSVQ